MRLRCALGWLSLVLALLMGGPALASAQSRTSSALRGTVLQQDSTPVAGAEVLVRHEATGTERRTVTNAEGGFLILLLQPGGPYTVTVRSLGFSDYQEAGLELQVGETTVVDAVLRPEALELAGLDVEVERAPIFDRSVVGPTTRLTERTVEAMPLMSRDVMDLALLSPLVKPTESGGFSVAGQNDRYNAILVDGVLNKDMFGLTSGGVPGGQSGAKLIPLDAISQYEVLIAPFDVRLSGFTGGVMNAVTRSGTNDWRVRASAVHRNEALMGDLNLATGPVDASGVDRSLAALSVGGPIVRDRAHFFVAGEFEERHRVPVGYNLFRDDPALVRISPEAMTELQDAVEAQFGLDAGTAGTYSLAQHLSNVFARVDWNLAQGQRMTLRNVFVRASNDEEPNRTGFGPYELSSNALFHTSTSNTTSLQLFSDIEGVGSNELELSVVRSTDDTRAAADWPQLVVDLRSDIDGVPYQREVRLGGNLFGQQNALSQTAVRLSEALSFVNAERVLTVGATAAWYDLSHGYLPGASGEYYFPSLAHLEANTPTRFQRGVVTDGEPPDVNFDVLEWGLFAQNHLTLREGLSLMLGIRLDVPHFLATAGENVGVLDFFGYHTSNVPSGNLLISPRWGFNWQSSGEHRTQLRVGGGMFTGQLPYIWLADALHNDGVRTRTVACEGEDTPAFDPGATPGGCGGLGDVVVFRDDFKFPQDIKFSMAVDRELTDHWSASLGTLFSKAIHQVKPALASSQFGGNPTPAELRLGDQRNFYEPRKHDIPGFGSVISPFDHVLVVQNDGEDWGVSITAEVRGQIAEGLRVQAGYSLARSWDRMSLIFGDMLSNFGLNPSTVSINKPLLVTSAFDRPHKFVVALFGAPPGFEDTEISLLFTGQSGTPFTYVYDFDLNGDGFPGLGGTQDRWNDPIYVPRSGDELPATLATKILTQAALGSDACLASHRGQILERNGCRTPWENRLDLRLAQRLRLGAADLRFEADLINVLNLLHGTWGRIETAPPIIPMYEECDCGELLQWGGGILSRPNGEGGVSPPWNPRSPDSQWQIQLGARVTFQEGSR